MSHGSHKTRPIPIVAAYFGDSGAIPIVESEFTSSGGWRRAAGRKRISASYARKLRTDGVTAVALTHKNQVADFLLVELMASRTAPAPVLRTCWSRNAARPRSGGER